MAYRRTPLTEARLAASRERVVTAAHELLVAGGYAAISVGAVAGRAEVATGTVYRHFASKSDLLAEAFRHASAVELAAVEQAAARPGSAADRLAGVVETFAGRALRGGRLAWALLAEPVDPAVEAERLVFRRAYRDVFADLISAGIAAGELPPQDPGVTAGGLVGAIGEALVGPLSHPDLPEFHLIPPLVTFCLRAAGATTTEESR